MFFFYNKDIELKFKPRSIEYAYLSILNDDLKTAGAIFETLDSPRSRWGKALVDVLNGYIEIYPGYFDIRNFFEIDLDFLLKNEKIDYVEQLLGALEVFSDINQEIYKYAARVMLENSLYRAAKDYMDKSKKIFYNDPELHFMLAKYHAAEHDFTTANFHINECLRIVPSYFPAMQFKKNISEYLE